VIRIEISHKTTKYATAERELPEKLKNQIEMFKNNEILNKFLNKIPAIFLILNKYRQAVYMSEGALEFTGVESLTPIIGKRPGEILGCIHHDEEDGGCGTSESCTYCGAVNVVLESQKGQTSVQDCRLTCMPNDRSYDLRIWAAPLEINQEDFTAITIQDISNEKRRAVYEKIFFHDIVNTLSGLTGVLQLLRNNPDKINIRENIDKLDFFINDIIGEVNFQRMLTTAEKNSLQLELLSFRSLDFLKEMIKSYINHPLARFKEIQIDPNSENIEIVSDQIVLRRVMRNMMNNAFEATEENGCVLVGCKAKGDKIEFWVNNRGFIPPEVSLQIFQRSFSTKGRNRGLGTYSMKLLSSFLDANVEFMSTKEEGTTFKVILPVKIKK